MYARVLLYYNQRDKCIVLTDEDSLLGPESVPVKVINICK